MTTTGAIAMIGRSGNATTYGTSARSRRREWTNTIAAETEQRAETKPPNASRKVKIPALTSTTPSGGPFPLRRFGKGRGDLPDVRHVEIARDGPLKGRRPGLTAWVAAE